MSPLVPHGWMIGVPGVLLGRVNHCPVEGRQTAISALPSPSKSPAVAVPVPVNVTVCGLPSALSVILTAANRAPVAVGVKVSLITQLPLGTTIAPFVHVVPAAMAKSPGFAPPRATVVMLKVPVPLLATVTLCAALVVLTRWLPNATAVVDSVTAGAPLPQPGQSRWKTAFPNTLLSKLATMKKY